MTHIKHNPDAVLHRDFYFFKPKLDLGFGEIKIVQSVALKGLYLPAGLHAFGMQAGLHQGVLSGSPQVIQLNFLLACRQEGLQ